MNRHATDVCVAPSFQHTQPHSSDQRPTKEAQTRSRSRLTGCLTRSWGDYQPKNHGVSHSCPISPLDKPICLTKLGLIRNRAYNLIIMNFAQHHTTLDAGMEALQAEMSRADEDLVRDLQEKFLISWLYHDNALDGVVLTYHELKAAIDERIISDSSLIPMYDNIRAQHKAIDIVKLHASKQRTGITMEFIKRLHKTLTVDDDPVYQQYRKENPLHRLYFHEIVAPEKISYRLRKLVEWTKSEDFKKSHPLNKAAQLHLNFITIYPWLKNSGKVARLLMNFVLMRHGYVPAVIHAVHRQRYYEVLRSASYQDLADLIAESLNNAIESSLKYASEFSSDQETPNLSFR